MPRQTQLDLPVISPFESNPQRELDTLLLKHLDDSGYRIGQLHFCEPLPEDELDELLGISDVVTGGWTTLHPVDLVMHPTRGALLLRDCRFRSQEPTGLLHDRIERVHARLVDLQRSLRCRLDERSYWRNRPIVLGVGVVVRAECPDVAIPAGIPHDLIIDEPALSDLEQRLQQLFEFHTTPATKPIERYGAKLIADLAESPDWIGNFIGKSTLELMHESEPERTGVSAADKAA